MQPNPDDLTPTLTLHLDALEYSLAPGAPTSIPFRLELLADNPDFFEIAVRGIPASWVSLSAQVVNLPPHQPQEVSLTITPPPPPQSQAGIYPIQLLVVSQSDPSRQAQAEISLRLAVFESRGRIGVMMDSTQFSAASGSPFTVTLLLLNQGLEPDSFRLGVEGLPVNWVSTQNPLTHLEPGEKKDIQLTILPPRSPSTKAGRHPFKILITSQLVSDDTVQVSCTLTIPAFSDFRSRLLPEQVRAGQPVQLSLDNQSNLDTSFSLSFESPDLLFEALLPPAQPPAQPAAKPPAQPAAKPEPQVLPLSQPYSLRIPAGQTGSLTFRARPAKQPLFGADTTHIYTLAVRPADRPESDTQALQGQVASRALLPNWVLPALAVLVLAFLCIFIFLIGQARNRYATATQTASSGTALVMGATQNASTGTAVAVGVTQTASANQTAAAAAGQLDSDADGLTDSEETKFTTDPSKPDTDADELTDGREVKELGTNPLITDSDGDGLSDGEEVLRRATNPLNPDTDGDGLLDGDEVHRTTDPLNPDSDRDGLSDGQEVQLGTNPLNSDSDNDQLLDGQETPPCPNPFDPDSDKDGIVDGKDLDPCDPNNPSLTATAAAGIPPTNPPATAVPPTNPPPTAVPPTNPPPSAVPPTNPPPTNVPPTSAPTSLPPTETLPPPPLPGAIAFVSDRDGNNEIYLQNATDQSVARLTNNPALDTQPAWSPDGSRVAFTTNRDGNNEIYLMNADGSNPVNLTNDPGDDQFPTWSPDGIWIAFSSSRSGNWEVYIITTDGGSLTNLTNNPANDVLPTWINSRGQARIAFATNRDGNPEIYAMNPDGTNLANLTNNPANDFYPAASRNGDSIAFVSDRDGNRDIFSMQSNGNSQVNLTNNPADDISPSWSPDGAWIAFSSNRGNQDIFVIRSDGSATYDFSNHTATEGFPGLEMIICEKVRGLLITLVSLLLLAACSTTELPVEQATATIEIPTQPSTNPAPGPVPVICAGINISSIRFDTKGLPYAWQPNCVAASPYDASMPPTPTGLPEHVQINFGVTDPTNVQPNDPILYIIPIQEYIDLWTVNGNQAVSMTLGSLQGLLSERPEPVPSSGIPILPWERVRGVNDLSVQGAYLDKSDRTGVRFVGRFSQGMNPVTNEGLFYIYQGETSDAGYLLAFFYPVSTSKLPDKAADVSSEEMQQVDSNPAAYLQAKADGLNALTPADWEPDLTLLDSVIQSVDFELAEVESP